MLRAVVLYSGGHLGSAAILSALARRRDVELVGLVRADALDLTAPGGLAKVQRRLAHTGWRFAALLAWQRWWQAVGYALGRWRTRAPRIRPGRDVAALLALPTLATTDVNGPAARAWLAERRPDLLISACFPQIVRAEVIALPRLGVLNVHPGWLPAQRGAMAYFWPLAEDGAQAGATVHWIDTGIDTGPILARRRLRVRPRDTQQRVCTRSCVAGARLLGRVLRRLARGEQPRPIAVDGERAAYFHMPGRAAFARYFARRRFFRIRDVLATLVR